MLKENASIVEHGKRPHQTVEAVQTSTAVGEQFTKVTLATLAHHTHIHRPIEPDVSLIDALLRSSLPSREHVHNVLLTQHQHLTSRAAGSQLAPVQTKRLLSKVDVRTVQLALR